MNDETSQTEIRARRGYAVIDRADQVDVTSYDSFPASDPPSWIATGIGSTHLQELAESDFTGTPPRSPRLLPTSNNTVRAAYPSLDIELEFPRMSPGYNAPLYLLPFDHRYCYVAGMFEFTPPLTTENSGLHEFAFEHGDAFAQHIEAFQPAFAKVLARYNGEDDAALNKRQTMRLKQLSDYCRALGQPFMFELLVPVAKAHSDFVSADDEVCDRRIRPHLTVETISGLQGAGVEPDGFGGFAVERTTFWEAVTDFMAARATRAETVPRILGWAAAFERDQTRSAPAKQLAAA